MNDDVKYVITDLDWDDSFDEVNFLLAVLYENVFNLILTLV